MKTKDQIISEYEPKLPIGHWVKYQKSAFRVTGYSISQRGNFTYEVGNGVVLDNFGINFQKSIPAEQICNLDNYDLSRLEKLFNIQIAEAERQLNFSSEYLQTIKKLQS